MAVVYQAEIRPTKLELLADWLPGQPWYPGEDRPDLQSAGSFRFDDPAGEVGIETLLVRAGAGPVLQVPLTYRAAPRPGGERGLITTLEHSVLGQRWVYDGCADPAYAAALAAAILGGGSHADVFVETAEGRVPREATFEVKGSGTAGLEVDALDEPVCSTEGDLTRVRTSGVELTIHRVVGSAPDAVGEDGVETLTGIAVGDETRVLLATARRT